MGFPLRGHAIFLYNLLQVLGTLITFIYEDSSHAACRSSWALVKFCTLILWGLIMHKNLKIYNILNIQYTSHIKFPAIIKFSVI